MTYIIKRRPVISRRPKTGLGWDLFPNTPSDQSVCLDQANAQVAPLDAKIQTLAKTWNPTGFYDPADVQTIVLQTMSLVTSATDSLSAAPVSTGDAHSQIQQALDKLFQQGQRSIVYVDAMRDAMARGANVLNAAGLKTWVLDTMQAASSALVTAAVMDCNMPWLANAIIAFQGYFDILAGIVIRIVGAVVKVGDTVLQVAEHTGDILTFLKWAVIIGGGAWGLMEISRRRGD